MLRPARPAYGSFGSAASSVRAMTKCHFPWPDVMKIFWPEIRQVPSASSSARVRSLAMSLPALGSVMSMQPHASPRAISSIICEKRVFSMVPFATSNVVEPSRAEKTSAASAMPPWNEKCVMIDTSARASASAPSM